MLIYRDPSQSQFIWKAHHREGCWFSYYSAAELKLNQVEREFYCRDSLCRRQYIFLRRVSADAVGLRCWSCFCSGSSTEHRGETKRHAASWYTTSEHRERWRRKEIEVDTKPTIALHCKSLCCASCNILFFGSVGLCWLVGCLLV